MNQTSVLRKVEEKDIDLLFEWANDEECRKNSFHSEKIEYKDHREWFLKKINDKNCNMYLCIAEDDYVGQVRLDIDESKSTGMISYSIGKGYRGKGYGLIILELLEFEVKKLGKIKYLLGQVKYNNLASQKVFVKLNYLSENKEDYIIYKKEI